MSVKMIWMALAAGLCFGIGMLRTVAPAAEDKPSTKNPVPAPSPAKPTVPTKPHEGTKPRTSDNAADALSKELSPPMSLAAIQAALATKVELNLTDVPLADAVAAIKRQTKLEIHTAADALLDTSGKPTDATPVGTFHLSGITAASALDLIAHDFAVDWGIDRGAVLDCRGRFAANESPRL